MRFEADLSSRDSLDEDARLNAVSAGDVEIKATRARLARQENKGRIEIA